jgi:exosortase
MEVKKSTQITKKLSAPAHYLPLLVAALFVPLFLGTFENLYTRWIKWDEGLSHGLLVIGVFIFLLAKSLPWSVQPQSRFIFLITCLGVASASSLWFLFQALNISILEQLILLPLMAMVLSAIYGFKTALQHRLLLLLPIFAIPIWDQLSNVLVDLSAVVVGHMVRWIQMPAVIDGNSIYIPYGHILIADGCSGLRYLVIALAIGYIIGYLNRYDEKRMLAILAIAGLIGLIANWLRIFILILVGYQTRMQSSLMSDHEFFGWLLFGLLCLPAIYFAPVVKSKPAAFQTAPLAKSQTIIPLLALAVGPLLALALNSQPQTTAWEDILPTELRPTLPNSMPVTVLAPNNSHQENGSLYIDAVPIFVQLNQYQRQTKNEKLVPYITHLYNSDHWTTVQSLTLDNHFAPLIILREKAGLRRVAQMQWFVTGEYSTTSIRKAKLLQIPALIKGHNRFMITTLQAECEPTNCDNAASALQQFAHNLSNKEP